MPGAAVNHLAVFPRIIAVPQRVNHSFQLLAKCLVGCRLASLEFYMHDMSLCTTKATRTSQKTHATCTLVQVPMDAKAPVGSKAGSGLQEGAQPLLQSFVVHQLAQFGFEPLGFNFSAKFILMGIFLVATKKPCQLQEKQSHSNQGRKCADCKTWQVFKDGTSPDGFSCFICQEEE